MKKIRVGKYYLEPDEVEEQAFKRLKTRKKNDKEGRVQRGSS